MTFKLRRSTFKLCLSYMLHWERECWIKLFYNAGCISFYHFKS